MKPPASVILTTYERPHHLALVLESYRRQTVADFQLIVADDGSSESTGRIVEKYRSRLAIPPAHVWHRHQGHGRTVILNRAIDRTDSDYVIFSDGDCLAPADLIETHLKLRRRGKLLIGGYVRLDSHVTAAANRTWVESGAYETLPSLSDRVRLYRRHLKNRWQILVRKRRRPHNLALNMSAWKRDLLRVNGYDENYRGWGNADGDLRERLKRTGVRPRSVWNRALVFHLHHPIDPTRDLRARNRAYSLRPDIPVVTVEGICKDATGSS